MEVLSLFFPEQTSSLVVKRICEIGGGFECVLSVHSEEGNKMLFSTFCVCVGGDGMSVVYNAP